MPTDLIDYEFEDLEGGFPWALWLDGKARQFNRGVDFNMAPKDFIRRARRVAWRRGLRVKVRTRTDEIVVIQAFPKETPA